MNALGIVKSERYLEWAVENILGLMMKNVLFAIFCLRFVIKLELVFLNRERI